MTAKPTIPANHVDGDIVTAAEWNTAVVQQGLYVQEVLAGINTDKIPATAISGQIGYWPNILVNGGLEIWQRNTTFTVGASTNAMTADRWLANTSLSSATVARNTPVSSGSQFCAAITYTHVSGGLLSLQQTVENWQEYKGKTVTFTADVYCTVANGALIFISDGVSPVFSARVPANQNTTLSVTLNVSASATTLTAAVQCDTASSSVFFDNAMLSQSSAATGYIPRPFAEEMLLCKRYYQKVPISVRWRSTVAAELRVANATFPVSMSAAPTLSIVAGSAANVTSRTPLPSSADGCYVQYQATAATTDTFSLSDILTLDTGT